MAVQADVGSETDVCRMYEQIDRQCGRLDALVNNAGIVARRSRVDGMDAERLTRIFAVNVTGAFPAGRQ